MTNLGQTYNTLIELLGCQPPWIVAVLNLTPDSFSDGGKFTTPQAAIDQAWTLKEAGAHIIEIGGESTRPGSKPIGAEEELRRIEKTVKELGRELILSIDTYRAATAQICLDSGARLINDVSALRADPEMVHVLATYKAFAVLMFNKDAGGHATDSVREYQDVVAEISDFLKQRSQAAMTAGIEVDRIILDPGMGRFISHSGLYSWELLSRFEELSDNLKQFPVMVCTSRKGFLGGTIDERDELSQLTSLIAVKKGAKLVRTHNPGMLKQLLCALSL